MARPQEAGQSDKLFSQAHWKGDGARDPSSEAGVAARGPPYPYIAYKVLKYKDTLHIKH